jgi:2-dehydropantoate 2-reductase
MKILILGAGGIGGYFGARLQQAGATVQYLVRPARQALLRKEGLRVESKFGDVRLPADARQAHETDRDYDFVFLTCKAFDLPSAIEAIAPAVGEKTAVLPLLNGVSHLQTLNDKFGEARVLGGIAKIAVTLTPDGVVRHLNDWCYIVFGEQDGSLSPRATALKALLDRCTGLEATLTQEVRRELWLKLVHLHTLACMTSLLRANVGEINRTPEGNKLFLQTFETNVEIARREGHAPDEKFIAGYRKMFSETQSLFEASLARDVESGNRAETEHLLGFMLQRCRAHGLYDAVHLLGYTAAKAYEERRAAGRLPR